jgi:hypothetical protein
MILSKLKLDESTELEFSIEIFGTPEKSSDVRFVIESSEFNLSIPCKVNGTTVTATIPKLKGILNSGEYSAKLECILDGKIFTPLNESVEFDALVEFEVKPQKAETIKEGVRITPKFTSHEDSRPIQVPSKLEESLRKLMEDGFDITRIDEKFIIKSNDLYVGIVETSGEIKMAKKSFHTHKELIEE